MASQSMLLVSSFWKEQPTFKLIPISKDCPFNEVVFDPIEKILAVVSKEKKQSYHILPKLDEHGDIFMVKNKKRADNKPYAEQRVLVDTYYEYFIHDVNEISYFINMFASNLSVFTQHTTVLENSFKAVETP